MPHTLFISDLHLSPRQPQTGKLFLKFLQYRAPHAEELYILGDLFEYWLGDDAIAPEYRKIMVALRNLTDQGVPLYIMHGNRDFLMGESFAAQTGCQLISDPTIIDLYGCNTLLMHGDTLCSDDKEYQQFRKQVRNPKWQHDFLSKPVAERLQIAENYRYESRIQASQKPQNIMDVNHHTVTEFMTRYDVLQLIHGHTHKPAIHEIQNRRRIVLGDWDTSGSFLYCDKSGCRLEKIGHSDFEQS